MGRRNINKYNGVLPVSKEGGYTSNDVVSKLRGILGMRRIGHTGTLDPAATGVLPVCLGRATVLSSMLSDRPKSYSCVCRLGIITDTEDMTGKILKEMDASGADEEKLREAAASFIGEYEQVPPMYSARKQGGKKLYELARQGIEVERKASRVRIYSLEISDVDLPVFSMTVTCSKGTYIRSLCRDIGEKLCCGAAMENLVRKSAAGFSLEECLTIGEVEECVRQGTIQEHIVAMDELFAGLEAFKVSGRDEVLVRNGNSFRTALKDGRYRIYLEDGSFAGVYEVADKKAQVERYLLSV